MKPLFEFPLMNEREKSDCGGFSRRGPLIIGLLLLLVSLAALSAYARQPYLSRNSSSWRTSKSSRMNDERLAVSRELRRTDSPTRPETSRHIRASFPIPLFAFRKLPEALAAHRFRSPPAA